MIILSTIYCWKIYFSAVLIGNGTNGLAQLKMDPLPVKIGRDPAAGESANVTNQWPCAYTLLVNAPEYQSSWKIRDLPISWKSYS